MSGLMKLPDGRPLAVNDGVIVEPTAIDGRITLWLPAEFGGGYQYWERIGTVAHAAVTNGQGVCASPVSSVRGRQWLGSSVGKLVRRLFGPRAIRSWTLPKGESVEQCGNRQTDLVLAWAEDDAVPLDEAQVRARWPESCRVQSVGRNLYLVCGVKPARPGVPSGSVPEPAEQDSPRRLADRALVVVREAGDIGREVTALADLGLAYLQEHDAGRATAVLEEALAIARRLGDPSREADVMSGLGLALLYLGQPRRALEVLGPALAYARTVGDRHAEKVALDRLGLAQSNLGDHVGALAFLAQALAIATETGDRHHEADLLWLIGIQHAELGQRDKAVATSQAAVNLMRLVGWPQSEWYAHHLTSYLSGAPGASLARPGSPRTDVSGAHLDASVDMIVPISRDTHQPVPVTASNPGILRMALTATSSMAKFLGSGFKTASPDAYRTRLKACSICEYHTGLRCRICGCFTSAKAQMLHEDCPAGRWPS